MILPGFLRTARFGLTILATLAIASAIIGFAWLSVQRGTEAERATAIARANATVTGLAASYAEQINRQTLALDQTLDMMARQWEADPRQFNLEREREHASSLSGIARDMFLADENGIIRQSSVPDFIGQSVADLDVFRDAAEHADAKPTLYLGPASVNPIMRQWHLDAARTLHHPDGSFAGIIDVDYRVSAINDIFTESAPMGDGFAALIALSDGRLRATYGAAGSSPNANIADSKMFGAIDAGDSGLWVGPSATDTVVRIHAFRRVPGRDLAVIAGLNEQEVMQPVLQWRAEARAFAAAVTGLTAIIAILVISMARAARRRAARATETRANLAAAQALAEVSRAHANAMERRLHATYGAVSDGIAIFDPHLNLVEWNALFPERSGVNGSLIRVGMPMEDVLRTQVAAGYFGEVTDVEAEVERRVTLLRNGNFGASLSFEAETRQLELHCRPLEEGGFVARYSDVTDVRRARQALRDAREALRREQAARMRFLDVIACEVTARVRMLARAVERLRAANVPDATVEAVRRVGQSLSGLATDAVEVPLMEAGAVSPRPELLSVVPLLRQAVSANQAAAHERGITVYPVVNPNAPTELIADPDRLRQVVSALLTLGLRHAAPDTMWLLADAGEDAHTALRITVRCFGTPLPETVRAEMFPAFAAVAVPARDMAVADGPAATVPADDPTGLGAAIAQHLTTLMGGQLRCEGWSTLDGRTGNDFMLMLPPDLLPGQGGRAPGEAPAEGRKLPRTRVLLAGAPTGLRMAAVTMLRRDGHMVDAVTTGEVTLRALETAPYDIAFLDIAQPDMSAETLVGGIRELIGPARAIPIILLAPPREDAEARLWRDIGVDEILACNPTFEELAGAIAHHVWLANAGASLGAMPGLEEETEEGIPILSAERIAELRTNLGRDELAEMVEECIADLFHRLPAFRRALAVGASGAITAQAHAMVGMASGYGMAVLEARLRAILIAVRGRRLNTIDGAAQVIEADLTRAAAALRRALRLPQAAGSGARS